MAESTRRVLTLPDIHYPLHNERALSCAERFMVDFQPTHIIYLGDALQMDCVSHWMADKRRSLEGQRLIADYNGFNTILDRHTRLVPDAKRVYILGNHEDWVRQYLDLHPQMEGLLEVERGLRLSERGFTVVPFGQIYRIGKLHYMHGVYTNEHHAKSTVLNFQRSVRYGHTHDIQHHTWVSPVDILDRHTASSVGCLCDINPHYMKLKPNRWMHAINVAYIRRDGNFSDYTIPIIQGRFTFEGKDYIG